jgi:putative transposase
MDGYPYHVLNRGNRRQQIFKKATDYQAFFAVLAEADGRFEMPIIGVCAMPNHFHIVVWPAEAAQISAYMHWVTNVHVHRYHLHYGLKGLGHLYQDRYKAFPIQDERHLYTVLRYVEGNPLRAGLVEQAEDWQWSSLALRGTDGAFISTDRVALPSDWSAVVNSSLENNQLQNLQTSARRERPYGDESWVETVMRKLSKK